MPTYLDAILAAHRAQAAADGRDVTELVARAEQAGPGRDFTRALLHPPGAGPGHLAVIAEVKRRSPSKGPLAPDLDPAEVARQYQRGGAACLSVLTDTDFFGGSATDLDRARRACALPVLRKDFTVAPADVCDARLMGADAVLLIVAALSDRELGELLQLARRLQLAALVEVHDESEAERALAAGAELVGVNQRDLVSFAVDTDRAERVVGCLPESVVAVAESGVGGPGDARRLADAGYQAVLVGETLVRAADRSAAVAGLAGHAVGRRRPAPVGP